MKNRESNSLGATALQVTLSVLLLFVVAIVFASNFMAAPSQSGAPTAQSGFYPPLPSARAAGPTPTCSPIEVDDKIASGDPNEMGRVSPSGTASSCSFPNACNTLSGLFHY